MRDDPEWELGHLAGSIHVPLLVLAGRIESVRERVAGTALAVACSAGNRAAVAVSMLERAGIAPVIHVAGGGVGDLSRYGVELTTPVVEAAR